MAVRAPDPHNLRGMTGTVPAPIIETDRKCLGCGYNLRGLRAGINCPECGLPSVMPEGIDDPLSVMPRSVILAFVWGCWTASACVLAVIAAVIASRLPNLDPKYPLFVLAFLSLMWIGATWLLTPAFATPQAIFHGFSPASKARVWARRLQWGWLLNAGCAALAAYLTAPSSAVSLLLNLGMWVGFLAGICGVIALCVLLEGLADWTRDDTAKTLLNWAMWGLPLVGLVLMLGISLGGFGGFRVGVGGIGISLTELAWMISLVLAALFPYALFSLSKSVSLSIVHSFENDERTRRREERRREYHKHVGKLVEGIDKRRQSQRPN